jgi:3-dehydroquinate synthase
MQEVKVDLPQSQRQRSYKVFVGAGLLDKIGTLHDLERYSRVFVLTDDTVGPLLLDKLLAALPDGTVSLTLPAGEQHKSIESIQKVWEALHEAGCDRKALLLNLGGGVICDLGGFAASTYMRGIDFLNLPTSLLAQADASVGGKTGFNFGGIKNLIGTFNQPVAVIMDTGTLSSLPKREFTAGFGEIIKHGAIMDRSHFEKVTVKPPSEFTGNELATIVAESCRIKAGLVGEDEAEGGRRKMLNFGHTVGHAVEALSHGTDRPLLHGEAVSIGMVTEGLIAQSIGLLAQDDLEQLRQALQNAGLPVSASGFSADDVLTKMRSDKKNDGGELNFTLIKGIGQAVYDQKVPLKVVTESINAIIDR